MFLRNIERLSTDCTADDKTLHNDRSERRATFSFFLASSSQSFALSYHSVNIHHSSSFSYCVTSFICYQYCWIMWQRFYFSFGRYRCLIWFLTGTLLWYIHRDFPRNLPTSIGILPEIRLPLNPFQVYVHYYLIARVTEDIVKPLQ
jgi:hypothetical protein